MSSELEPIDPHTAKKMYLDERRHEVADATLQAHHYRLKQFVDWCEDDGIENLNDHSGRDIHRFRMTRRDDGLANATMKGQLATLRMFLRFSATIDAVESGLACCLKKVVALAQIAIVGNPRPAVQKGLGGYADWVIVLIHGIKTYLDLPVRRFLDVFHEMPRIARSIDLIASKLPDFTTVCARMQELQTPLLRVFLRLSTELHDTGEIQAIKTTGMDRIAASQHYAKRTNYTFKAVKTTASRDFETCAIQDIQCSMKQPHDSQIA
jgi:hypothetical protein